MKRLIFIFFLVIIMIFIFEYTPTIENKEEKKNELSNENEIEKNIDLDNLLSGKTIAFFGDSLIRGYGNDDKGFDYYLKENLPDTNFINNSKSGSTLTTNSGEDDIVIINQVKILEENPDIIILDGGANDVIGYSLGFLNRDLEKPIISENNNESVMIDFEETLTEIKNKFPNAKICYFNPFLIDDETIIHLTQDENLVNEIKQRRDDFFSQAENVCGKLNVDYLDASDLILDSENKYRKEDYIHLNEEGYKLLTPILLEKINEIANQNFIAQNFDCLVIGNSITIERDGIGMAATDEYHDYYFILKSELQKRYKNVNMNRISAIQWEENRVIKSRTDWINENLTEDLIKNKDLVIFQLGDNCVPTETFEESVTELVNYVRNYSPNAKMLLVGMWFINEERLNMMPEIAQKLNLTFVDISDLVVDENKSYIGSEIVGIDGKHDTINTIEEAFHPNNQGMQKIAEKIIEKLD